MTLKNENGGPAFPLHPGILPDWEGQAGMSMRDWFAGQALAGFAANNAVFAANNQSGWELVNSSARGLADQAYWLADAMIAAGKGKDDGK